MGSGERGHSYEGQHQHQCKPAHLSCKGAEGQIPASGHVCVWPCTCRTPYSLSRAKKADKQAQDTIQAKQPLAAQSLEENGVPHAS